MLKFVASQILETFGSELSFRIGGDEFVVFLIDPKESEIKEKIITMTEAIEEAHYHIATGLEIQYAGYHSMDNVIKSAELKMYRSKARYYEESGESRL